jgi:hypothetical protein
MRQRLARHAELACVVFLRLPQLEHIRIGWRVAQQPVREPALATPSAMNVGRSDDLMSTAGFKSP